MTFGRCRYSNIYGAQTRIFIQHSRKQGGIAQSGIRRRVLQHAQEHATGQIRTILGRKSLEPREQAQGLAIALESSGRAHAIVECDLSPVPKWWMAQVMRAGHGLNQAAIWQQPRGSVVWMMLAQQTDDPDCNLCHFQRMGKAGPIEVAVPQTENLSLALQSPEGGGMDHSAIINITGFPGILFLRPPRIAPRLPGISNFS